MKYSRSDKEDMVGPDGAVLGRNRRALDQWQEIALHAFARYVSAPAPISRANFVDFVEKYNPLAFDFGYSFSDDLILVE